MKITKYVHSCLLVETPDRVGVFDPGSFSQESFQFDKLTRLDDIIITHEHPDHFHLPFIKELLKRFPEANITANSIVADELKKHGISAQTGNSNGVDVEEVTHESMVPLAPPPHPNAVVHYLNKLTHAGDSHHFSKTMEILALPITAPWGTSARAAQLVIDLKPKHIIPIHDAAWTDDWREWMYDRFEALCQEQGSTFHKAQTGVSIEF